MSISIKDRLDSVAEAAKDVGHKIADGAVHAVQYVREMAGMETNLGIQPEMEVIASCGKTLGVVESINGLVINLKVEFDQVGVHHSIPTQWVQRVDGSVHLNKTQQEAMLLWKTDKA